MNLPAAAQQSQTLSALLRGFADAGNVGDVVVTGVSEFSGDVAQGDLFLATASHQHHGLMYCEDAISKGAVAVAWEPGNDVATSLFDFKLPNVCVENLSSHVAEIAQRFYGDTSESLTKIAITGTDGKSSVAYLVAKALDKQGNKCGLIGTLGYGCLNGLTESTHTTPPVTRLQKELSVLAANQCEYVAIEASSHGIDQNRLQNINIHTAVLTNISRDHLDYHKTVEAYIAAKAKLFFTHQPNTSVMNMDDPIGRKWLSDLNNRQNTLSYSLHDSNADVYANSIQYRTDGTTVELVLNAEKYLVSTCLLGEFNVQNLLAVAGILLSVGIAGQNIKEYLEGINPVPGRMQLVNNCQTAKAVVDFAHTPNALSAAIDAARAHFPGKLICVFGCGGDRDQGKRPLMGKVAAEKADYVIVTSDNPRYEDPQRIIDQIMTGCDAENCVSIPDRKQAIQHAIKLAQENDVVLIAGKGHEKYQWIAGDFVPFDDVTIAENMLSENCNG